VRCYLLGVELIDGRIMQLVESESQENVDQLAELIARHQPESTRLSPTAPAATSSSTPTSAASTRR
jgi:hypothetical protein